ncbi:MAG TPA: ABC-F family ATP-binding cassette domain-containing protein [Gaiellaceae bacterium]|nr:ABC-F family ATP-binding cassette domain-containing protein [Gaiellaceae bacterium]
MRVQLAGVGRHHGARTILDGVTLTVSARSRIGLVGPNGAGKSTLLRIVAGLEAPDAGSVARDPATLTVGYLPQEPDARAGETVLASLARRAGLAAAQAELERWAGALAAGREAAEPYAAALERLLALGGGDFEARASAVCAELGLGVALDRPTASLSGGQAARAALAAILLSRFDVLLLDEPTNDLDFEGLDRLERFLLRRAGGLVLVSHDRELLDRVVTRIVEVDPWTHGVREWAGGWSEFAAARAAARTRQYARFEDAQERRRHVERLLARRRSEARAAGGAAGRRGTHALMTKVRQAERALERVDDAGKPYEPWALRLSLRAGERGGDTLASLRDAVAARGRFRLGPVDLEVAPGDRVVVTGRNGSGKSTLLAMLLGELPLEAGDRRAGRRTSFGVLAQDRRAYGGAEALLDAFTARTGLAPVEARTLLAKFGLGAEHVGRETASLSPGERTRAHLAELQARGVNLLLLDEPTNHLDLEAVEQLEAALAGYDGALVVVSHDRRFLEAVAPTAEIRVEELVAQSH